MEDDGHLQPEIETVVYRVVQESLTNVVRHARASRAEVEVSIEQQFVRAVIVDDGIGFELDDGRELSRPGRHEGAGLLVGGKLGISSTSNAGTMVTLEVPH